MRRNQLVRGCHSPHGLAETGPNRNESAPSGSNRNTSPKLRFARWNARRRSAGAGLALTSRGACSQLFTGLRSFGSNQQFPHPTAAKRESDRHSQGGRYRPKRFSFTSSTSRLKSNKTAAGAKLHTPVKGGGGGSKCPTAPYVPDVNGIPIKRRGNYSIETLGVKPAQNIPNGPQKCNLQLIVT